MQVECVATTCDSAASPGWGVAEIGSFLVAFADDAQRMNQLHPFLNIVWSVCNSFRYKGL